MNKQDRVLIDEQAFDRFKQACEEVGLEYNIPCGKSPCPYEGMFCEKQGPISVPIMGVKRDKHGRFIVSGIETAAETPAQ